jgi:tripartite-type tricarboxylate transporter receptor subunit TctC
MVENRPGASNTLAADATAKSTDGHTLLMGVSTAHAIAPHILKLGYDSNRDLVPIIFVSIVPNVLVINNDLGVDNVDGLVRLAKARPGKLNFATSGTGSTQHIAAILFQSATGVQLVHVPYKGSGPALMDLMGGQVQLNFDTFPSVIGQINAGKIKALAVTSAHRSNQLPNVPTMGEAGVAGVEMGTWYGVYMPSATPKAVQERVWSEVTKVLALADTKARLDAVGAEMNPMSQAKFIEFHQAEFARYGALIRKNNITVD